LEEEVDSVDLAEEALVVVVQVAAGKRIKSNKHIKKAPSI
jgi:hypothetical protein